MENGNITVIGARNPENKILETKPIEVKKEGAIETVESKEKSQEADNTNADTTKSETKNPSENALKDVESKAKDDKEKIQDNSKSKEAKTSKEEKQNAFAVSFDGEKKEVEQHSKSTENKQEAVSMTKESVLQFLKTEFPDAYADVNDISELSKKVDLSDPVSAFQKFNKETGRGIKDFYNLQKDWSKESPENTLKEFYKLTSDGLSDDDIETQLDLISVTEEHEYDLSEDDLKRRKLNFKKEYNKALKFMQSKSKEYETPLDSVGSVQKPLTEEQIAESYRPYWDSRDKSIESLKDFEFSIGIGDIKLSISDEDKKLISKRSQTHEAFFQDWNTDKGINTDQLVEDVAWGIPSIRKQLVKQIAEQVHALSVENESKSRRNVNLDKIPEKAREISKRGVQVFGRQSETTMGQPLIRN